MAILMMADIRPFLRLQTDAWLQTLQARVSDAVLQGAVTTSFSNSGQSGSKELVLPTAELASQLTDVLIEKEIVTGTASTRMTFARFAR